MGQYLYDTHSISISVGISFIRIIELKPAVGDFLSIGNIVLSLYLQPQRGLRFHHLKKPIPIIGIGVFQAIVATLLLYLHMYSLPYLIPSLISASVARDRNHED